MGNTWAMTRGLATAAQARSILGEYRRRQADTGDAYPWWSLQPGYPAPSGPGDVVRGRRAGESSD
jgi:hypothetical protein